MKYKIARVHAFKDLEHALNNGPAGYTLQQLVHYEGDMVIICWVGREPEYNDAALSLPAVVVDNTRKAARVRDVVKK